MLKLTQINKYCGDTHVLIDINLNLNTEIVALIGENGAGKTTLLKLLLGEIAPDDGFVQSSRVTIGYVPQHTSFADTIGACFSVRTEQWRMQIALEDVGLNKPLDFSTANLSGGQKTRLAIAMVLAQDPTPNVLLLDEPTNNLDSDALLWLEQYVKGFKGAVIVVSHDRQFINKTASKVLELHKGSLTQYAGNYDSYRVAKDLEHRQAMDDYEATMVEKKHLEQALRQRRELSRHTHEHTKRNDNDKYQRDYFRNRVSKQFGQQARALESRLEQIEDIEKPEQIKTYEATIRGNTHNSNVVARLDAITVAYIPAISDFSLTLQGSDRVRIAGRNGSGKTTILKIAAGLIQPDSGSVSIGENVTIGYLSQEVDGIDQSKIALENLEATGAHLTDIYREARALGLKAEDLQKMPNHLSRGQQSKLSFAKLLLSRHELLVLDEPTNHLDIPTREVIEGALRNYNGAILVASHDEYFLKSINIHETIQLH